MGGFDLIALSFGQRKPWRMAQTYSPMVRSFMKVASFVEKRRWCISTAGASFSELSVLNKGHTVRLEAFGAMGA
jgi:hypothetical protein